jgi:acyl-coenzyme A thioesterase PaaI-like protein
VQSTLPQGKGYTSAQIKVSYLRAVRLTSGLLTATGTVVKAGAGWASLLVFDL